MLTCRPASDASRPDIEMHIADIAEWFMTFIVSLRIVSALFSATRPARPPQVPITGIQIPTTQPPSSSLVSFIRSY